MKYEWQKFSLSADNWVYFSNTPLACVVIYDGSTLLHEGVNLTLDGKWIPAPGFNPHHASMMTAQNEIDELTSKLRIANGLVEDLLKEMGFNEEAQEKNSARELIYAYRDIRSADAERAGRHEADCKDAELKINELEEYQQRSSKRIGELMGRISSIEAWATQTSNHSSLRIAQAHVLRLARGEL
jgi:hypothetical protein